MAELAWPYSKLGRWKEAEELVLQALDKETAFSGAEHPDTLRCMNYVADIFWGHGRKEEAISLMDQCLQLQEKVIGPQHPDTKDSRKLFEIWKAKDQTTLNGLSR